MRRIFCLFLVIVCFGFFGCASFQYSKAYKDETSEKYAATKNVQVFQYSECEIEEIYDLFFKDYEVIGQANFYGEYEHPNLGYYFAKAKGADVLLANHSYVDSTSHDEQVTKKIGAIGFMDVYVETTETTTTNRYDQNWFFLRKKGNTVPVWEQTEQDFRGKDGFKSIGIWSDNRYVYKLELYKYNDQIYAFNRDPVDWKKFGIAGQWTMLAYNSKDGQWNDGDLKFTFDTVTGKGIFLVNDKTPYPAKFTMDDKGKLQIDMGLNYGYTTYHLFRKKSR